MAMKMMYGAVVLGLGTAALVLRYPEAIVWLMPPLYAVALWACLRNIRRSVKQ
jgi:hypothetical protein